MKKFGKLVGKRVLIKKTNPRWGDHGMCTHQASQDVVGEKGMVLEILNKKDAGGCWLAKVCLDGGESFEWRAANLELI